MYNKMNQIFDLYDEFGQADYIGEHVTQTQHMLECAQLAETHFQDQDEPNKTQIILAALFHDIGHLVGLKQASSKMSTLGITGHEHIGANFLRSLGFVGLIPDLVEKHVQAKRYLTYINPEYLSQLSDASTKTLKFQGGPMTHQEAIKFELDPHFNLILLLRTWDDQSKTGKNIKTLDYYKDLLQTHLKSV